MVCFLLGEPEFLRPVKDRPRVYHKHKPWRLRWCDRVDAEVTHVACGNGFSLIATSNTSGLKGHHLFGTGMNIQSQIGIFLLYFKSRSELKLPNIFNDQSSNV